VIRFRDNNHFIRFTCFLRIFRPGIIGLPGILLLLIVQQSCSDGAYRKVVNSSRTLADKLAGAPPPQAQEAPSTEQRVYIDHSESMKGFVSLPTANSGTIFNQFVESMPDVLPGCKVYKYGQPFGLKKADITIADITFPAEFDDQLRNPASYRLEYNPDDILLNSIVSAPQPAFSVLITDGVESDSQGKVNTKVIDAIRSWMIKTNQ
jgi:hypothetical protein